LRKNSNKHRKIKNPWSIDNALKENVFENYFAVTVINFNDAPPVVQGILKDHLELSLLPFSERLNAPLCDNWN